MIARNPVLALPPTARYLLVGVAAWFIVVVWPLQMAVARRTQEAARATQQWTQASAMLGRLDAARAAAPAHPQSTESVVVQIQRLSTEAGIDPQAITHLDSMGNGARLQFSGVPGDALVRLLYRVQAQGLVVEQWDMTTSQQGIWSGNAVVKSP